MKNNSSADNRRSRRSPEEQINDLQKKIEAIKARAEQAKIKKSPSLRHVRAALKSIDKALKHHMAAVDVLIPYQRGELVSLMHEHGVVEHEEHTENGTHLQGRLPVELAGRFARYWVQETVE